MSTKLKIAAAVAAAVLLSACSSPKHEPMPLVNFTPSMEVTEVWSKGLSSAEGFLVPAVYDDMVFAAGGKTLTRLNARTGETEWSVSFDSPITGGVGSDGHAAASSSSRPSIVAATYLLFSARMLSAFLIIASRAALLPFILSPTIASMI